MKKNYVKPEIVIVDLRPEEQIGENCPILYAGPNANANPKNCVAYRNQSGS